MKLIEIIIILFAFVIGIIVFVNSMQSKIPPLNWCEGLADRNNHVNVAKCDCVDDTCTIVVKKLLK